MGRILSWGLCMNEKLKFATLLIVVVLVSVITSYATTLALNTNKDAQNNQQEGSQQSSNPQSTGELNKIYPKHEDHFSPLENSSKVTVISGVALKNLTIVYQFTSLNGTAYTEELDYGDYFPTWGPNNVVQAGETQFQYYRIPQSIISACSSTKAVFNARGDYLYDRFDVYPKLTITVFGYG
jgi:hypothetical protein